MKALIDKFYIGINETRVGLLLIGRVGQVVRSFSASQSVEAIKTYIDGLKDVGSSPGITSGLTRALEIIKDQRPDVKQVGFLSRQLIHSPSDCLSGNRPAQMALDLRRK